MSSCTPNWQCAVQMSTYGAQLQLADQLDI